MFDLDDCLDGGIQKKLAGISDRGDTLDLCDPAIRGLLRVSDFWMDILFADSVQIHRWDGT